MTPTGSAGTASGAFRDQPPAEPTDGLQALRADMIAALPGVYPWGEVVDALLSGPLAPLLAKLRAVERVEKVVHELGRDLSEVDPDDLDEPYMWHQRELALHGELARALWAQP